MSIRAASLVVGSFLMAFPVPATAQCSGCPPWWTEEVAVVGANVLLGALTAALWQELKGGSFQDGFSRGALGGAVAYAGKRVATADFPGAGLVGREVAAVGYSIVRNAAEGRGTFERVRLPLGFLPAHLQLGSRGRDLPVRLDALAVWSFVYGLAEPKLEFDLGRSLSWGAAVFVTPGYDILSGGDTAAAIAPVGAVFANRNAILAHNPPELPAHERVHVIQADAFLTWGDAADDWLEARIRPLGWVSRLISPNVFAFGMLVAGNTAQGAMAYNRRPWELEAMALAGRVR